MKRFVIIGILLLCLLKTFSQSDSTCVLDDSMHCNPFEFFMMINGKLPLSTYTIIKFDTTVYADSVEYWNRNNFKSYSIPKDKLSQLCELIPDSAKVYLKYCFYEPIDYNQYRFYKYLDTLHWWTVKGIGIVIISDISIKKGLYYIHYELQPPYERYIFYKQEYGKPKRFIKKVFKGVYPHSYSIPEYKKNRVPAVPKKTGKGKSMPTW